MYDYLTCVYTGRQKYKEKHLQIVFIVRYANNMESTATIDWRNKRQELLCLEVDVRLIGSTRNWSDMIWMINLVAAILQRFDLSGKALLEYRPNYYLLIIITVTVRMMNAFNTHDWLRVSICDQLFIAEEFSISNSHSGRVINYIPLSFS